jgi:hypothetical protein
MHETITITLAKRPFKVAALDIETLSRIFDIASDTGDTHPVARNARIVAAALRQDHPGESLDVTVRPTLPELGAAASAILRLSGLVPAGDDALGEAAAPSTGA